MACCKDCDQLGDAAADAMASVARMPVAKLIQIGALAIAGLAAVAVLSRPQTKGKSK